MSFTSTAPVEFWNRASRNLTWELRSEPNGRERERLRPGTSATDHPLRAGRVPIIHLQNRMEVCNQRNLVDLQRSLQRRRLSGVGIRRALLERVEKRRRNFGTAYGYQIAKEFISPETGEPIDQMRRVIELLRNDPLNRRILTTLIDFGDLSEMTLVPCAFQTLWTVAGNRLHMTLIQRSGDFLAAAGPGSINAFQYYALLRMVAQVTGYEPGQFVHFVQNLHIYERHIPQIEEIIRVDVSDKKAPRLELNPDIRTFEDFTIDDFTLSDYEPAEGKYDIPIAL